MGRCVDPRSDIEQSPDDVEVTALGREQEGPKAELILPVFSSPAIEEKVQDIDVTVLGGEHEGGPAGLRLDVGSAVE